MADAWHLHQSELDKKGKGPALNSASYLPWFVNRSEEEEDQESKI